jgi:galactokinase
MIGVFSALWDANALQDASAWQRSLRTLPQLGGYLGAMENGLTYGALAGDSGVGTMGGSQDQTAIFCSEANHVVDFGWMPVRRLGAYALSHTHCFVVASSGVMAEKSAGAREQYNRASMMVTHMLTAWNASMGRSDASLAAAVQSDADAPDRLRGILPSCATVQFSAAELRVRLDQFLFETYTLIPAAAAAFAASDWSALGDVAARSQRAAEEMLGNQIPPTIALVRIARERGAVAASAFGAGFGGSVWALVPRRDAAAFQEAWAAGYGREFPSAAAHAMFFRTDAGPAAMHWRDDDSTT